MSGLKLTKSHVKGISDTGHFYVKDIDPPTTDWLAMYDLLVWFKECDEGLPDKGRTVLANQMTDKIRVLIGGE